MYRKFMPAELTATFVPSAAGYISTCSQVYGCPPFTIAYHAERALEAGRPVTLPEEYDLPVLRQISAATGAYDEPVRISDRQARELAQIGRELLAADTAGTFPLKRRDRELIELLVDLVADVSEGPTT
ncbi:hypothetical protein ACFVVM_32990 [Nocardia sp. NPDC058176]|uniref:hypothetical protein n=1 Tax=Nocardia sp. NPDC058176 TaxID=3346368 RepID=UPI0036D90EF0